MPVPAVEGVALAGGGGGLAHDALGVGDALLYVLTGEELAAVGDVHHVEQVLLLGVLGPLREHGHVVLAGHGLLEVDLAQSLLLVGQAVEAGDPVPACEGVALAGGGQRLAHVTLGVGQTLLNFLTVGELAAVGDIRDRNFFLLFGLISLVVNIKLGDALEGGGHIHFDLAGCDDGDDLLGGVTLDLALDAIRNIAACRNLDNGGLAGAIAVAANKVAHNLDALGCILLPCGKPGASLRSSRLVLVIPPQVFGNVAHVGVSVPALEGIAGTNGLGVNPIALISVDHRGSAAVGELAAVGIERELTERTLLGSIAVIALASIIGESYCRHATESKCQAQTCCYCFLRAWILHLFSFLLCISLRPAQILFSFYAVVIKQPSNTDSLRNIRHCSFLHNRYARGITRFMSSMRISVFYLHVRMS